jgi:hypothetical protein
MWLSEEEQTFRRKAVQDALTNTRLSGLEPDPIFFDYAERYVRGDMTIKEIIADYKARVTARVSAMTRSDEV